MYRTYSMYARGMDIVDNVYQLLDRAPLGRNEDDDRRDWLRRHDEYPRSSVDGEHPEP